MTPSMTAWPPTRVVSSPLSRIGISWVWVIRRKYVRRDTDPLRILLYQSRSPSFATFRTLPHKAEPYATLPHRYTQTPAALISSTPPPTLAAKRPGCATSRIGLLVCLRLHLTSRAICATGRQFVDWSADYRLCSRSVCNPQRLFDPLFHHLPALLPAPGAPVIAALDDTLCKKTGRHIPGVGMGRDPMSPAFHVNLCYGLRFVQVSLLVSPVGTPGAARALPVRFDCAPPAVKPKKNAAPEMQAAYKEEKKL